MVLRILPFLIILLIVMIGSKSLEIIETLPLFVKDIKAQENNTHNAHAEQQKDEGSNGHEASEPKVNESGEKENKLGEKENHYSCAQPEFGPTELSILQNLASRREFLDKREQDISLKEASLNVIEKNIEIKMTALKDLQMELKGILQEYQTKEDEKIMSLVKIYESMKPQDAAKIFGELKMSVLIEVADYMKEAKLGAILAKMDTYKAKELTIELSNRRRIKEKK